MSSSSGDGGGLSDIPPMPPATGTSTGTPSGWDRPRAGGLAITSLVLGILGVLTSILGFGGVFGLIGLILGIIALATAKRGGRSKGIAISGVVLSAVAIIATIVLLAWLQPKIHHCQKFGKTGSNAFNTCMKHEL
jgi:membrane-bound ClpP family serine protease